MKTVFVILTAIVTVFAKDDALEEFVNGNLQFTADVYKEILKTNDGNFLVSPLSAETVLALLVEGAKGETSEEFVKGLKLPNSKEKTTQALKSLLPSLQTRDDNLKLYSANKIYVNNGFSIKDDYKQIAKNVYFSDVENINFGDNVAAADTINSWVEEQTNKKITNLVEPKALTSDIKVLLINTLYFNGNWINPFDNALTIKEKFYTTVNDSELVDTMHTTDYFNYYEDKELKAKFLEMPYVGDHASLTIVLPNKKGGLSELEGKLEAVLKTPQYTNERVYVSLPKFTIESQIKFVPILRNLGISKAFIGGEADLSGIGAKKGDLYVSDVLQKTFINVTESGTEAASATAEKLESRIFWIRKLTHKLYVNRPFLFYVKYKDVIIFVGKIKKLK